MLGAQIMTDCERYLGLSMVGGKSKVATFKEILERIAKRVMGWKEKYISKAGRQILIKTENYSPGNTNLVHEHLQNT